MFKSHDAHVLFRFFFYSSAALLRILLLDEDAAGRNFPCLSTFARHARPNPAGDAPHPTVATLLRIFPHQSWGQLLAARCVPQLQGVLLLRLRTSLSVRAWNATSLSAILL